MARPDTRAMTCTQTRALIQSKHAVVPDQPVGTPMTAFVRQFGIECDWPENTDLHQRSDARRRMLGLSLRGAGLQPFPPN